MIYAVLLILFVGVIFRFGYQFGTLDHVILALHGISKADPTAFVNDFFVANAPQPHWFFDLYTEWGESLHLLREFYFAYWTLSVIVYGWALLLICRHLKIEKYAWAIAFVMLLMPVRLLGSGPFLGSWALPHFLGGSLAALACAFWLEKKDVWLWLLVPVATIVHTQQGALISMLLFGGSILQWRQRWRVMLLALLNLILVYAAAKSRLVTEEGDLFLKLCKTMVPGHCYAPAWPIDWLMPLFAMAVVAIYYGVKLWRDKSNYWAVLVLVATITTIFGTLADYLDIEPFASLFRRMFMHRMAAFSLFFTVLSLIPVFQSFGEKKWFRWSFRGLSIISLVTLLATDASVFREEKFIPEAARTAPAIENAGQILQVLIPPGETIAMDPRITWMRYISRRAVIADTKAFPNQTQAFNEWAQRFQDLGGGDFSSLSFVGLARAMRKYNAHYLVINSADPKIPEISKEFQILARLLGGYSLYLATDQVLGKF